MSITPRSVFHEIERTRIGDGVMIRMVDRQRVFSGPIRAGPG